MKHVTWITTEESNLGDWFSLHKSCHQVRRECRMRNETLWAEVNVTSWATSDLENTYRWYGYTERMKRKHCGENEFGSSRMWEQIALETGNCKVLYNNNNNNNNNTRIFMFCVLFWRHYFFSSLRPKFMWIPNMIASVLVCQWKLHKNC